MRLFLYYNDFSVDYKVTVQDVINSSRKVTDDWGVQGYYLPKFDAKLDKSTTYKIGKASPGNFMAMV